MSQEFVAHGLSYRLGRNMRGELKAHCVIPLGDMQRPRLELHIETSKRVYRGVECSAVVYERTEDGKGLVHKFGLSSHGESDYRNTLEQHESMRCTEKAIRAMHERNLARAPEVVNHARGFYVAQQAATD